MNGRLILAGHNPRTITLRDVLDVSVVLVAEDRRAQGMDYFDAIRDAITVGIPEAEKPKPPVEEAPIDNNQAMNALMGALSGTGKKFG